jgi:hypothetical protein
LIVIGVEIVDLEAADSGSNQAAQPPHRLRSKFARHCY